MAKKRPHSPALGEEDSTKLLPEGPRAAGRALLAKALRGPQAGAAEAGAMAELIEETVAADSNGDIERYRKWLRSRVVSSRRRPPARRGLKGGVGKG